MTKCSCKSSIFFLVGSPRIANPTNARSLQPRLPLILMSPPGSLTLVTIKSCITFPLAELSITWVRKCVVLCFQESPGLPTSHCATFPVDVRMVEAPRRTRGSFSCSKKALSEGSHLPGASSRCWPQRFLKFPLLSRSLILTHRLLTCSWLFFRDNSLQSM